VSDSNRESDAGGGSGAFDPGRRRDREPERHPASLEELLRHAPQAIVVTERPSHLLRRVNPAFCRLVGVTADDLLNRPFAEALPGPFAAGAGELLDRVFSSGEAEPEQQVTWAGATSEPVAWSYTVWPLRQSSGTVYGLVVEVRDRTHEMTVAQRMSEVTAEIRQVNQRLLASALREHEWAEALDAARGELRRSNEELERRVAQRTAELARTNDALAAEIAERERAEQERNRLLRQLVTAVEDEGRRISRELHDQLGQQVTALMLGLDAARQTAEAPALAERIRELERLAASIARDMQHLALELRPPVLDSLGVFDAMQSHLAEWGERHGIAYDFFASGMEGERLTPEIETTLYRVVQEGLTNVLKHASATRVSLVLERRGGVVHAILEDDGAGFDAERELLTPEKAKRLGLRGIRERVALLGGAIEVESAPGSGTTLYVRIPYPAGRSQEPRGETGP
jgi:PAS domain S-box-containing protein